MKKLLACVILVSCAISFLTAGKPEYAKVRVNGGVWQLELRKTEGVLAPGDTDSVCVDVSAILPLAKDGYWGFNGTVYNADTVGTYGGDNGADSVTVLWQPCSGQDQNGCTGCTFPANPTTIGTNVWGGGVGTFSDATGYVTHYRWFMVYNPNFGDSLGYDVIVQTTAFPR